MPERILEVRMFELRYACDGNVKKDCDGVMVPTGEVLQMQPPRFKHRCQKCGDVKFMGAQYPMTMGLPIGVAIPDAWIDKLIVEHVSNPPEPKPKIITS